MLVVAPNALNVAPVVEDAPNPPNGDADAPVDGVPKPAKADARTLR